MIIDFSKMHGLGNDFILIDCLKQPTLRSLHQRDWQSLSRRLCDRRFGVGADQVLLLLNSPNCDYRMRIFNADGSEVEMCGNGIRCLAKYIWNNGLSQESVLSIETPSGTIKPQKMGDMVKVDMGKPLFEGKKITVEKEGHVVDYPLTIGDQTFSISCVSMGNPHAVIMVDDVANFPVSYFGPRIEAEPFFPMRTNVEFIQILDRTHIQMRVWERGAGETMACGTGACASAVVATLKGHTERSVNVRLTGGDLYIEWPRDEHVYMTGPAEKVFEGSIEIQLK